MIVMKVVVLEVIEFNIVVVIAAGVVVIVVIVLQVIAFSPGVVL